MKVFQPDSLETTPVVTVDSPEVTTKAGADTPAERQEKPAATPTVQPNETSAAVISETVDDVAIPADNEGFAADSLNMLLTDSVPVAESIVEEPVTYITWENGLEPIPRQINTGNDQGFVTVIVLIMLGLSFSVTHIRRIWGSLIKQLWTTRPRQDFNHITMAERRTVGMLIVVTVFLIGLITTAAIASRTADVFEFTFTNTLTVSCYVGAYFLFQYIVYLSVGYAFTSSEGCRLWVEGFTAAMSMLGFMLLVPALLVVFYPALSPVAIPLSAALYIIARIMFIYKGFRIFYTNFGSIVYFILYLCTLEIVPVTFFLNIVGRTY